LNLTDVQIHVCISSRPVRPPDVLRVPDDAHVPTGCRHRQLRQVPAHQPCQRTGLLCSSRKWLLPRAKSTLQNRRS
jgi:hypothetical protein